MRETPAIRFLKANDVHFTPFEFEYVENGGTSHSSTTLGVSEHAVIKTLIMELESSAPLVVLMHGDQNVATKELARQIGAKSVKPCRPEIACEHSGYLIGGTSPFGLKKTIPVYMERSILEVSEIYINGGARGFLVRIDPREITRVLSPVLVHVAAARKPR